LPKDRKCCDQPLLNAISFSDVHFNYIEGFPVLDGATFSISKNGLYVLAGGSGGGKTTILDIAAGLYTQNSGKVEICGYDSREFDTDCFVAGLPQEPFFFGGSIRENLLLADPEATENEMEEALHRARAEFAFELENGLDAAIGDGSGGLSGGQLQRLQLAQAFLRKTDIVLMDEPTSALDWDNEREVITSVVELAKNKIVLVAAHRQSWLDAANEVFFLKDGRISY